jgi:hypothetical protein
MKASVHTGKYTSRKTIATDTLLKGLKALGIDTELRHYDDPPSRDSDFAVVWGHKHRCCAIARACALPLLILEMGCFGNRATNFTLTWNWGNRLGIRPEAGDTLRPQPTLAPWRESNDGRIVVFDQTPTDIQFQEVAGTQWAERIAHEAGKFWGRDTYVRPHPNVRRTVSIDEDLRDCWMGITYTSSSAINCVAAGVPCIAVNPKSMAWDVTGRTMEDRVTPDRSAWAHWLSWCQWTGEELEDGSALTHILKAHDEAKDKVEEITRQSDLDGDG